MLILASGVIRGSGVLEMKRKFQETQMVMVTIVNFGSLVCGLLSAVFWVVSAVVKAPPADGLEGKPDGSYWGGNVLNGGDLYGTLRAQAKWNSRAAFAASAAVLLQIAAGLLGTGSAA